jgi:hypothetical protein
MSDPLIESPTTEELIAAKKRKYGEFYGQCDSCRHYMSPFRCNAFKEIPPQILTGEHDHREPYPGDNGIQFEPIDNAD